MPFGVKPWLAKVGTALAVRTPQPEPAPRPVEDRRTPEDIKNGWTLEAFDAYHAERAKAAQGRMDWTARPRKRPTRQVSYNPWRWRR